MPKLIIDTDTGSDDAIALLMALAYTDADVVALTTVAGNVELDQATRNAKCTLRVAGRSDVEVYSGCDRPLVRTLETAVDVHGADGLGNTNLDDPGIDTEAEHAVPALVRFAAQSAGSYDLITLGPLTNVAAALAIDPLLLTRFRRTVIMGGAPDMVGNITDMAEFNIWVDPEAAARVFAAPGERIMVGWNIATSAGHVSPEQRQAMGQLGTASGRFARDVTASVEEFCHQEFGLPIFTLPDPIAVAIALDASIATRTQRVGVRIGLSDEARGATFPAHLGGDVPVTDVVWEADAAGFQDQMFKALAALP